MDSTKVQDIDEINKFIDKTPYDDDTNVQFTTSSINSNILSSEATSLTSKNTVQPCPSTGNNSNEFSKTSVISEKRFHRDTRSNYKPKNIPKEPSDIKHMEKELLKLLEDFRSGKLSAFGSDCSIEQMINIRDQQEHLAKLHFQLCADVDKPVDNFENPTSKEKMSQLVKSLEQLTASIENLHSKDNDKKFEN